MEDSCSKFNFENVDFDSGNRIIGYFPLLCIMFFNVHSQLLLLQLFPFKIGKKCFNGI